MTLQELLDREEIRTLQCAYNIAGDRGRTDEMVALFAPEGILTYRRGTARGTSEIAAHLGRRDDARPTEGHDRPAEFLRHNLTTSHVEFASADAAQGRTYFIVFSEIGVDHMGLYADRYERIDEAWKIVERIVRIDWVAEGGHSVRSR